MSASQPTRSLSADAPLAEGLDPLTQVLSRQGFLAALAKEISAAEESGQCFTVCLANVDQLRNINDQHGQQSGDEVLVAIADRVRRVVASAPWNDHEHCLARYDGNGFIVLTRDCKLSLGAALADRLRSRIAASPVARDIHVTASVGVAQYRIGESADSVLARTEQALYLAKQFGRDCVEVAESHESSSTPSKVLQLSLRRAPNRAR